MIISTEKNNCRNGIVGNTKIEKGITTITKIIIQKLNFVLTYYQVTMFYEMPYFIGWISALHGHYLLKMLTQG